MWPRIDSLLKTRFAKLRRIEKDNLRRYNLEPLSTLCRVHIEVNFIRAAAQFWDSQYHVFRFGGSEICPTVEEFQAMLGYKGTDKVIFPTVQHGYKRSFCQLFNIGDIEGDFFLDGGMIHIEKLLTKFNSLEDKHSLIVRTPTENALCLALVARFLLIRKEGYADMRLCPIIPDLKEGGDFMPIVLGETINNLDILYDDPTADFKGSPLLLQIWLLERLKFINPPREIPYHPRDILRRGRLYQPKQSLCYWIRELERADVDTIAWTFSWYNCGEPRMQTRTYSCFCFFGLYETSFIFPFRIMRQFGVDQDVPFIEHELFPKAWLGTDILAKLKQNWYGFQKGLTSKKTYNLVPTAAYKRWYATKIMDREIARAFRRQNMCADASTRPETSNASVTADSDKKGKRKRT